MSRIEDERQQQLQSRKQLINEFNILTSRSRPSLSHDYSSSCSRFDFSSCQKNSMSITIVQRHQQQQRQRRRQHGIAMLFAIVSLLVFVSPHAVVDALPAAVANSNSGGGGGGGGRGGLNVVKLPSLYWHVNNRLFSDPNQQEPNYYLKLNAHLGESIDLVCPRSTSWSSSNSSYSSSLGGPSGSASAAAAAAAEEAETYGYAVIYRVASRHEFDNCIVDANNYETVPILKCDKPHSAQLVKFTIYFVKYSPVPNALEFEEGKEYFFLSTSSGSRQGLEYASGGLCAKYNMRFSIRIQASKPAASSNEFYSPKRTNTNSLLTKLAGTAGNGREHFDTENDMAVADESTAIDIDDDEESELDEPDTRAHNSHSVNKHYRHHHHSSSKSAAIAAAAASSSLDGGDELNSSNMNLIVSLAPSIAPLSSLLFLLVVLPILTLFSS